MFRKKGTTRLHRFSQDFYLFFPPNPQISSYVEHVVPLIFTCWNLVPCPQNRSQRHKLYKEKCYCFHSTIQQFNDSTIQLRFEESMYSAFSNTSTILPFFFREVKSSIRSRYKISFIMSVFQ